MLLMVNSWVRRLSWTDWLNLSALFIVRITSPSINLKSYDARLNSNSDYHADFCETTTLERGEM